MKDEPDQSREPPRHEPAFNAPWPVLALVLPLIVTHAARVLAGISEQRFALTGQDLAAGRWAGLVSYLFVHGSWAHVLMNALFTLAFGTPVARYLGLRARGALAFFAFFIACGVIAALAYAGLLEVLTQAGVSHRQGWALVGASGAASGLMGAAARLIDGHGRLGGLGGRAVVGMTVTWIAANALLGLSGLTPGASGLPVAWEAHIFGYFAGLVLIGLFARGGGVRAGGA